MPKKKKTTKKKLVKEKSKLVKRKIIKKFNGTKSVRKRRKRSLKSKGIPKKVKLPKDKQRLVFLRKANVLLERSKKRGFVTYGEILKEFPQIEDEILHLDELYELLQ